MPTHYTIPALVDAISHTSRGRHRDSPGATDNHPYPRVEADAAVAAPPDSPKRCARWSAKRACRRTCSSCRCSSAKVKGCGAKCRRCPACSTCRSTRRSRRPRRRTRDGVKSVLLFGLPDHKDDIGSAAYDPEAPVQAAIRAIKREAPDVLVDHGRLPLRVHRSRPLRHRRSTARSRTIQRSISWCARRSRTRPPAPTSSRPRT